MKMRVTAKIEEEPQPTILSLVKFIAHQTCISAGHISKLVSVLKLREQIGGIADLSEEPQPSILHEALSAPDPVAVVTQAIEEDWTVKQVREEVAKKKEVATRKSLPIVEDCRVKRRIARYRAFYRRATTPVQKRVKPATK